MLLSLWPGEKSKLVDTLRVVTDRGLCAKWEEDTEVKEGSSLTFVTLLYVTRSLLFFLSLVFLKLVLIEKNKVSEGLPFEVCSKRLVSSFRPSSIVAITNHSPSPTTSVALALLRLSPFPSSHRWLRLKLTTTHTRYNMACVYDSISNLTRKDWLLRSSRHRWLRPKPRTTTPNTQRQTFWLCLGPKLWHHEGIEK